MPSTDVPDAAPDASEPPVHIRVSVAPSQRAVLLVIDDIELELPPDLADRIGAGMAQAAAIARGEPPCVCERCCPPVREMN